jgi:hypothetical protein
MRNKNLTTEFFSDLPESLGLSKILAFFEFSEKEYLISLLKGRPFFANCDK